MIFYVFLDGIGFGEKNSDKNPFTRFPTHVFSPLSGNSSSEPRIRYVETDANMGISGLPQSATGQTALWTGFKAPIILGRHLSGFPSFTLKKIIAKHSMIKILNENGVLSDLINCYTPAFFKKFGPTARHLSASTLIQMASSRELKTLDDLREGRGIYMDITHEFLRKMNYDLIPESDPVMDLRDPYEVGKSIPSKFSHYGLCIYEYFLTDKIGHDQNWELAEKSIAILEKFILGFLDGMNPAEDTLILTSDHGNMEDLSVGTHTKNPVPTMLSGKFAVELEKSIKNLADIPPNIYKLLNLSKAYESWESSNFHEHRIEAI
ncbi:MAG: metalloenzyme [Leptospira sp.]|nr:metalloenzyme [Leptospira sp.]NCS93365.1 metalloenzyme [Leptospira sp.]